jgi:hypothetical protein
MVEGGTTPMNVEREQAVNALAELAEAEQELFWTHLPHSEWPDEDQELHFSVDPAGHLALRYEPEGLAATDTLRLVGFDQPEGVAVFRVRAALDNDTRVVSAWRLGTELGAAAIESFDPNLN